MIEEWDTYRERVTFICAHCEERLQIQAKELPMVSTASWRRLHDCSGDCASMFEDVRHEVLDD